VIDLFVPSSHEGKRLSNFDWSKFSKVKGFVSKVLDDSTPHGLFLFGDPGVGKTHILVGMFAEMVEEKGWIVGQDVMYVQWSDLVNEISEVLKQGAIPEVIVDRLTQVKVLITDDVRPGWGRVWNDTLKRIIERVNERNVKWIVSANVNDIDDLIARWNIEDYWLSRMKESVQFIHMQGEDRRELHVRK